MFFGATAVQAFLIILAIFTFLYWVIPQKHCWIPYLVFTVLISYFAFQLVPDVTDDLYRYYTAIDDLRVGGWDKLQEFIDVDNHDMKDYISVRYLLWFVSRLNNNHWLQTIAVGFTYGTSSLMFVLAQKRFNINRFNLYVGTMFFLSTYWFYDLASGIRNGFCFAIIVFCSYILFVEKRFVIPCIFGYIVGFYMHSASLLAVAIVVVTLILYKFDNFFMNIFFMFSLMGGNALVQYLAEGSDNSLILSIAGRAERHVGGETLETGTMFRINLTVFAAYVLIVLFVSFYCKYGDNRKQTDLFYKYCSITGYFMLSAVFSGLIFVRFARWVLPILGGLLFAIGSQQQTAVIENKGALQLKYYSQPLETFLYKLRPLFMFVLIMFTAVHLYYLCNGSSLYWAHFRYEWEAMGNYDFVW